jgi:hypothetical protein
VRLRRFADRGIEQVLRMVFFLVGAILGAAIGALVRWRSTLISLPRRRRLGRLTKQQLYERAQEADIPGRSSMNKEELQEAVAKHEGISD